jgi:hypothetical protein
MIIIRWIPFKSSTERSRRQRIAALIYPVSVYYRLSPKTLLSQIFKERMNRLFVGSWCCYNPIRAQCKQKNEPKVKKLWAH